MENKDEIVPHILSIDCTVGSGSVAILSGESVIVTSSPADGSPSRAEDVLRVIDSLLSRADLQIDSIDRVAVSVGPGSYSGIRIGLATALGLAAALSVDCLGVSVLEALSLVPTYRGQFVAAVAVGKRHIGWDAFEVTDGGERKKLSAPLMQSDQDFGRSVMSFATPVVLCDPDLAPRIRAVAQSDRVVTAIHHPIAALVGIFAKRHPDLTSLTPIYLRDAAGVVGQPVSRS